MEAPLVASRIRADRLIGQTPLEWPAAIHVDAGIPLIGDVL
jgi:hypothetical protein